MPIASVLVCLAIFASDDPTELKLGQAHNENFVVSAPTKELAEEVLKKAESLRREIATEWLGEELPPSVGQTSICARLSENSEDNRTYVMDEESRYNLMYLISSRSKMLSSAIAHEVTHTVLATQFRGRLPAWADEGAASLKDDSDRVTVRRRTIAWFAKTGNWPEIQELLDARVILPSDRAANSVAASITEYILTLGDKPKFLQFAVDGKRDGWDTAVERHYRISSVKQLQANWQTWASRNVRQEDKATARTSRAN